MSSQGFEVIARCYGSMALFLSIAHNVFLLYYVDMFVNVYKIDKASFWIGEVTFLVWNSINDPLFGWLSDKRLLEGSDRNSEVQGSLFQIVSARVQLLRRTGPLFAVSFMLFWIHWLPTFVQFVLCLCMYDGFLTAVDLQHTALLADLAIQTKERNSLNRYCSIFSALGSVSVFVSYIVWSRSSTVPFQIFCLGVTMFSAFGFYMSSSLILRALPLISDHTENLLFTKNSLPSSNSTKIGAVTFIKQLAGNKNFIWFVLMNLIQVFHCHFNSNFFPLFMNALIGDSVPSSICTLIIGLSFVAPHLNNIFFLHLCEKHGVYSVINLLFWIKFGLSLSMFFIGSNHVWIMCMFIASNRIFTEGTCKLLNLVVSDMVDEDYIMNDRPHPVSALLFGMSSLLAKPGQTFAPLLGTLMLSVYTGKDVFHSDSSQPITIGVGKISGLDTKEALLYREACFTILVLVPIICASAQLMAWSRFSLKGCRLQRIKSLRLSRSVDCAC